MLGNTDLFCPCKCVNCQYLGDEASCETELLSLPDPLGRLPEIGSELKGVDFAAVAVSFVFSSLDSRFERGLKWL